MRNKLDKAFLKLDETQKKLSSTKDVDIELMREFNRNFREITYELNNYYNKPSLLQRAFRLLF